MSPATVLLVLNLASWHVPDHGFDQFNPGAGIELRGTHWLAQAGGYRNSFGRGTTYGLVGYEPWRGLGVFAGLASGYTSPVIGGLIWSAAHFNVLYVPPVSGESILGIQATIGANK